MSFSSVLVVVFLLFGSEVWAIQKKSTFQEKFLKSCERQGLSIATVKGYRSDLKRYLSWCHEQEIEPSSVLWKDLVSYFDYLESLGSKKATLNRARSTLSRFYRFGLEEGLTVGNPIESFNDVTASFGETDDFTHLNEDQVHAILSVQGPTAPRHHIARLSVLLTLASGVRLGELEKMRVKDLVGLSSESEPYLIVRKKIGTVGETPEIDRQVPLDSEIVPAISQALDEAMRERENRGHHSEWLFFSLKDVGRIKFGGIISGIASYLPKELSIPRSLSNSRALRRTYVYHFLKKGGREEELKANLGIENDRIILRCQRELEKNEGLD